MYKLYMYCIATTYCTVRFDMYAIFEANRRKIFLLQVKRNLSYYTMLIAMLAMYTKKFATAPYGSKNCGSILFIKANNLVDPQNKGYFTPDKKMDKVFGSSDRIRFFGMSKYLDKHFCIKH